MGFGAFNDVLCRLIAFRTGVPDVDAQHGAGQHQVVKDVVSITHPSHGESFGVVVMFHDRHQIGGGLARVVFCGKGVDDGNRGVLGQFFHIGVCKATIGHAAQKAREDLGRVANRFRLSKLDVVFQKCEGASPQTLDAHLERNSGSRGRFFVNGTDGQRVKREEIQRYIVTLFPEPLEFNGPLENAFKIFVNVINGQQVFNHANSNSRRLLSVVRSVLFVLDIGRKAITSIAHATEQGLSKGQNIGQSFLEFG